MGLEFKMVYLLLGSNLGERKELVNEAVSKIDACVGKVVTRSAMYETAAWGKEDQPPFLNLAVGVETKMTANELLVSVLAIEQELGRVRLEKWGARLIDIDVILYGQEIIDEGERLQVPHPRMQDRKFVLEPLAEIAGEVVHPVFKQNISTLLSLLKDNLTVSKIL
ncbi:2-amino-4-hydroxy-6-hydroxymethyldihydropteridine diphosphokinase [Pedobacter cryoconitis]|uniref:2-amino-4-hydroxy-6-hydroxymethyldihydropteridine pyrophosphokinase n=1 Tax=Pedobacter cryoconitis TaxID=188932 RepID=A0A7W9E190_9SPHI|nr:2-amino-4-hydroxy-6-hydroxymethyldihydropteridine diphosphokinase [Pedobacter cryoconitis]MBB5637420.1 2-amino-4-hydroxy-6-hydroxymethyldihydropteridine diphosphokinase [Pedobacter cryoconitis]MBB6269848.1 2-amino-4-hydroxy-6-hydroxymethyldihydropteridine diphosphokinase [Pedobacter cryoconitis]